MSQIYVRPEEDIEDVLRRFKRAVAKDGNMIQWRRREFFVKRSLERQNRRKMLIRKKK